MACFPLPSLRRKRSSISAKWYGGAETQSNASRCYSYTNIAEYYIKMLFQNENRKKTKSKSTRFFPIIVGNCESHWSGARFLVPHQTKLIFHIHRPCAPAFAFTDSCYVLSSLAVAAMVTGLGMPISVSVNNRIRFRQNVIYYLLISFINTSLLMWIVQCSCHFHFGNTHAITFGINQMRITLAE